MKMNEWEKRSILHRLMNLSAVSVRMMHFIDTIIERWIHFWYSFQVFGIILMMHYDLDNKSQWKGNGAHWIFLKRIFTIFRLKKANKKWRRHSIFNRQLYFTTLVFCFYYFLIWNTCNELTNHFKCTFTKEKKEFLFCSELALNERSIHLRTLIGLGWNILLGFIGTVGILININLNYEYPRHHISFVFFLFPFSFFLSLSYESQQKQK